MFPTEEKLGNSSIEHSQQAASKHHSNKMKKKKKKKLPVNRLTQVKENVIAEAKRRTVFMFLLKVSCPTLKSSVFKDGGWC